MAPLLTATNKDQLATINTSSGSGTAVTTIDFDSFAPTANFPGGVEDGFFIEVHTGPIAVNGDFAVLLGGPFSTPNSIHHPTNAPAAFALTNIDGSSFTLENFYAGSDFGGADPLIVTGFVEGVVVGVDVFDPNPPGTYVMFTPTKLAGHGFGTFFGIVGVIQPSFLAMSMFCLFATIAPRKVSSIRSAPVPKKHPLDD